MAQHTPTLTVEAGRCIVFDEVQTYTLHRVGNDSEGYAATPTEADAFVRTLVRTVNAHEELVKALEGMIAAWHKGGAALAIQDAEHALAQARREA